MSTDWIIPDWPAPANVRAVMTTRAGGVSAGEFGSLNLGKSAGDAPERVIENRARVRAFVGRDIRWLHQMHGTRVIPSELHADGEQADGQFTRTTDVACAAMAADCMPVLFCAKDGSVVASAHAGWRGLSAGVLEATISAISTQNVPSAQILAWMGPCIGPTVFEVGPEVKAAFLAHAPEAEIAFIPHANGKFLCDLVVLARQRLRRAGVHDIYGGHWCTMSDPVRFFSYRRAAASGRMAALIWKT